MESIESRTSTTSSVGIKACGEKVRPGGHGLVQNRKSPHFGDNYGDNQANPLGNLVEARSKHQSHSHE